MATKTVREAKQPSHRIAPNVYFQPDRHYVKVQTSDGPGGTWRDNTLNELLFEVDIRTGQKAYQMEYKGDNPDHAAIVGKENLVIISCSKEYAAFRQSQLDALSKRRAATVIPIGNTEMGTEYDASADMQDAIRLATQSITGKDALSFHAEQVAQQQAEFDALPDEQKAAIQAIR